MATILLHNKHGRVVATALVDDEDFAHLGKGAWRLSCGYARSDSPSVVDGWAKSSVQMHQIIMGEPPSEGIEPDHINRNKLDNRRCNLRWVTRSENHYNKNVRKDSKSGHKNVQCGTYRGQLHYKVRIKKDGKRLVDRRFHSLEKALAYRDEVLKPLAPTWGR